MTYNVFGGTLNLAQFNSTTPTPTSSRGSAPTRPTRAISGSHSCGWLNDTPTFSRRSSLVHLCRRGCRCRCRRRGMQALCIGVSWPWFFCAIEIRLLTYLPSYAVSLKKTEMPCTPPPLSCRGSQSKGTKTRFLAFLMLAFLVARYDFQWLPALMFYNGLRSRWNPGTVVGL